VVELCETHFEHAQISKNPPLPSSHLCRDGGQRGWYRASTNVSHVCGYACLTSSRPPPASPTLRPRPRKACAAPPAPFSEDGRELLYTLPASLVVSAYAHAALWLGAFARGGVIRLLASCCVSCTRLTLLARSWRPPRRSAAPPHATLTHTPAEPFLSLFYVGSCKDDKSFQPFSSTMPLLTPPPAAHVAPARVPPTACSCCGRC
jgi:hypothetical protein